MMVHFGGVMWGWMLSGELLGVLAAVGMTLAWGFAVWLRRRQQDSEKLQPQPVPVRVHRSGFHDHR